MKKKLYIIIILKLITYKNMIFLKINENNEINYYK